MNSSASTERSVASVAPVKQDSRKEPAKRMSLFLSVFLILAVSLFYSFAIVDAINLGDILIVDSDTSSVISVDPSTGFQTTVPDRGLVYLSDIEVDSEGNILGIYKGRDFCYTESRVIKYDLTSDEQTNVSIGGNLFQPLAISLEANGDILVAENGGYGHPDLILRIDPATGAQTILSSGGNLKVPIDIVVGPTGNIYVADKGLLVGQDKILQIDPITGSQSVVSQGLASWQLGRMVLDTNGDILVHDGGHTQGRVIRVNPTTGAHTIVSTGESLRTIFCLGMTIVANGDILVLPTSTSGIVRINPLTGAQTLIPLTNSVKAAGMTIDDLDSVLVSLEYGGLLRFDPSTGNQVLIQPNRADNLNPIDIMTDSKGGVFVTNPETYTCIGPPYVEPGWVTKANPETESFSLVSQDTLFIYPERAATASDDNFIVLDRGIGYYGSKPPKILRLEPDTGQVSLLYSPSPPCIPYPGIPCPPTPVTLMDPIGITVDGNDNILIGDSGGMIIPPDPDQNPIVVFPQIVRFDPSTLLSENVSSCKGWVSPMRLRINPNGDVYAINESSVILLDMATGTQLVTISSNEKWRLKEMAIASNGDVYVINGTIASQDDMEIILVDPTTGTQSTVWSDSILENPTGMVIESGGDILVTDRGIYQGHGPVVIRIDPSTGTHSILSSGGDLVNPWDITIDGNGDILAVDSGIWLGPGSLIKIDPVTGDQLVLFSGGYLHEPQDIAIAPNGDILIVDPNAFIGSDQAVAVIRVDPSTGSQELVTMKDKLHVPTCIDIDSDGTILVTELSGLDGWGAVIDIDPVTGGQEVSWIHGFTYPHSMEVSTDGSIIVGDPLTDAVMRVDPTTGERVIISTFGGNHYTEGFVDLTLRPDNDILALVQPAVHPDSYPSYRIMRINPATGAQTLVSTLTGVEKPVGIALVPCPTISGSHMNMFNFHQGEDTSPVGYGFELFIDIVEDLGAISPEDIVLTVDGDRLPIEIKYAEWFPDTSLYQIRAWGHFDEEPSAPPILGDYMVSVRGSVPFEIGLLEDIPEGAPQTTSPIHGGTIYDTTPTFTWNPFTSDYLGSPVSPWSYEINLVFPDQTCLNAFPLPGEQTSLHYSTAPWDVDPPAEMGPGTYALTIHSNHQVTDGFSFEHHRQIEFQVFIQGLPGQTITMSVTLTQNIVTDGSCPGIIIGASGITLEGDGYKILGVGERRTTGVLCAGHDDVEIKHHFVEGFVRGVVVYGYRNEVTLNSLRNNDIGVVLTGDIDMGPADNLVNENIIADNQIALMTETDGNVICHNLIVNNTEQVWDMGGNTWEDDVDHYGNFWGNYWGNDTNGDYIGDTDLPHEGVDWHPLLDPSKWGGGYLGGDWWMIGQAWLIWRGGWSPVDIQVIDPSGNVLSIDINEIGRHAFYVEDQLLQPGTKLVLVLIGMDTREPYEGVYSLQMTAHADLDYWMTFLATQQGAIAAEHSITDGSLSASETDQMDVKVGSDLSVTVLTPPNAIDHLIEIVESMDLHRGIQNSLISKLENAKKSLEKGKEKAARNQLQAFIQEVEAQRGKKITDEQADKLVDWAQRIIDHI